MVSRSLQGAAEALGFTYAEKQNSKQSHMYGVYGGYLITLYDSGNHKTVFINYYLAPNDAEDDSVRLLEKDELRHVLVAVVCIEEVVLSVLLED